MITDNDPIKSKTNVHNKQVINAQWRKVKQMQPLQLCFLSGRPFEETFGNTHSGDKSNKCNQRRLASNHGQVPQ